MPELRSLVGLPPRQMGVAEDVGRSALSQGSKGVADLAGGIGQMHHNLKAVNSYVLQKVFGYDKETADRYGEVLSTVQAPLAKVMPDSEDMRSLIPDSFEHEPQTWQGDIVGRTAYNVPGAVASGGGSLVNRVLSAGGAAIGGFLGKEGATKAVDAAERWMPQYKETIESYRPYIEGGADIAGNVVGSFAPNAIQHAVTPNPMTDERLADARILDDHGVEMTAGQRTGNEALHYKESQTGGSAYWNTRQRQNRQYTAGALEDAGIEPRQPGGPRPDVASPAVINRQHEILGAEFDRLQGYGMQPDTPFFEDLVRVRDEFRATMPRGQGAPLIETTIRELSDRARRGIPIDGEYLRKTGTMLRNKMRSFRSSGRTDEADAISDLIEVIDDGVERSLATTAPDEVGRWRDVRGRYRNLITVEEAASNAPNGQLSPADLTRATKKMETRRGYSRGFGPFNNYSRAGDEILRDPPNSGTTSRLVAALGGKGLNTGAAAVGGGLGWMVGGPVGAGIGAGIGAGADIAFRAGKNFIRMTPAMQAYLANQLARDWQPGVGAGQRAFVSGVTSSNRQKEEKY